jgi:hypothetical protein
MVVWQYTKSGSDIYGGLAVLNLAVRCTDFLQCHAAKRCFNTVVYQCRIWQCTYGSAAVSNLVAPRTQIWQCHLRYSLAVPSFVLPSTEIWQCHVRGTLAVPNLAVPSIWSRCYGQRRLDCWRSKSSAKPTTKRGQR